MSAPGWYPPEAAKRDGMIRRHNGIGWFWTMADGGMARACATYTSIARERGDVPPEERPHVDGVLVAGCGCAKCEAVCPYEERV